MRILATILLLSLASCGGGAPARPTVLEPPPQALAAWKPSLHLADTALSGGAPAIALQISDQLLVKDPRDVGALVRRGDALTALGRDGEAASSYALAIKTEPDNGRALIGLGRESLSRDPAAAESQFARAVALDPGNAGALSDLGVARDLQGHHAAAQDAYRLALGAAPASVAVQVNLGLSLALTGDAAGAVRLLRPLATAPDAAPKIRQDLALALTLSGRRNEAEAMMAGDLPPDQLHSALDGFEALRP
jgi:Tfp pilus assembly protein PilF